jgi:hypothetical protein
MDHVWPPDLEEDNERTQRHVAKSQSSDLNDPKFSKLKQTLNN